MNGKKIQIDAVVLAAGNSSRFGSDKRLFLIDGVPMLQCAIASVINDVNSVIVVLKQDDLDILPMLLGNYFTDTRVFPLLLNNPEAGIGSNLAHAVNCLPEQSDGVLVMLADMPYVPASTVSALVKACELDKIVAPVFVGIDGEEKRGHPVFFSRRFFAHLALLAGDNGARALLSRNVESVIFLPVADRGILQDIDVFPA